MKKNPLDTDIFVVVAVRLSRRLKRIATKHGNGNASAGIREALEKLNQPEIKNEPCPTCGVDRKR